MSSNEVHRLYRSRTDRMLSGLCGGLGQYLDTDPSVVRVVAVLLSLVWPVTPLAYLVLMLVIPEEPVSAAAAPPPAPVESAGGENQ
jgi:phage shock protein PspC (stress-responsive transcriptional regulator)